MTIPRAPSEHRLPFTSASKHSTKCRYAKSQFCPCPSSSPLAQSVCSWVSRPSDKRKIFSQLCKGIRKISSHKDPIQFCPSFSPMLSTRMGFLPDSTYSSPHQDAGCRLRPSSLPARTTVASQTSSSNR